MEKTSLKHEILLERLLLETKVKTECTHEHMYEDYCMICKKVLD